MICGSCYAYERPPLHYEKSFDTKCTETVWKVAETQNNLCLTPRMQRSQTLPSSMVARYQQETCQASEADIPQHSPKFCRSHCRLIAHFNHAVKRAHRQEQ